MDTLFAICPTYAVEDGQATGFMLMRREPDGSAKPWMPNVRSSSSPS